MENVINVAVKAIILFKGKALIIQRSDDDEIDADIWEFVGGRLEFGEDLKECLRREIKEEVNLDVEINELLYAATFVINERRQTVILAYLCAACHDHVVLSSEHKGYMWADKEQMMNLLAKPIIHDLERNFVWDRLKTD